VWLDGQAPAAAVALHFGRHRALSLLASRACGQASARSRLGGVGVAREEKGPILKLGGERGWDLSGRADHTASFALHVGEALERLSSLSDIVGPISLSRIDPAPGLARFRQRFVC
jgi:hypothetical protein